MKVFRSIPIAFILTAIFLRAGTLCEVRASAATEESDTSSAAQVTKREVRIIYPSHDEEDQAKRPILMRYNPQTKYGRQRNLLLENRQRKPKSDAPQVATSTRTMQPRSVNYRNKPSSGIIRASRALPAINRPEPADQSPRVLQGVASWYGRDFHGQETSNGEIYNMFKRTAAHRELPFDTHVRVTNLSNGRSTIVRINDRGPFVPGRDIDLSYRAAYEIGMLEEGVEDVRIEIIGSDLN
jgi:rare lipoprotein A (peptidoglycan hydrolase)